MVAALFLIIIAALVTLIWRLRQPPYIYALSVALWVGAYIWNMVITASCSGDCNIRVDLLLVLPVVLFASLLAARAFIRSTR